MSGTETPGAHQPTLTEREREAVYDRYDTWLRAPAGSHCHLPAGEDGDEDHPTPVCGARVHGADREWRPKDPACFPGEWARLCVTCAEIAVRDE